MPLHDGSHSSGKEAQLNPVERFPGFEPLTANFLYCPNQFFDVCLPNCSRGTVRLVAYLIRRILGWHDAHGDPIEQNVRVSYGELSRCAGISRRAIRQSIEDAIDGGFILCVETGRPKSTGQSGRSASYTLRWDAGGQYNADPKSFEGFYRRRGHRSPIPNAFFDEILPREQLAVVKVVGTVLRYTVGYENQFGIGRRTHVDLSYSEIQRYSNLRHRPTLSKALHSAMDRGLIRCVSPGLFDPNAGLRSRSATYAVHWQTQAENAVIGAKTEPERRNRGKNRTGIGAETEPGKRGKNRTGTKTDQKDTFKRQQAGRRGVPSSAAAEPSKAISILRGVGFDQSAARNLAAVATVEEIQKQIEWIDLRNPTNRLAMLRIAIENKWDAPASAKARAEANSRRVREREQEATCAENDRAIAQQLQKQLEHRKKLLAAWRDQSHADRERFHADAIQEAASNFSRAQLRRHRDLENPPLATPLVMARSRNVVATS